MAVRPWCDLVAQPSAGGRECGWPAPNGRRSQPTSAVSSASSSRWCNQVVEPDCACWSGELDEAHMPGGLRHRTPLFGLVADLGRSVASAGESCVAAVLVGPADHACTSEVRDLGVGSDAHTAADGEPVDEDDATSLAKHERARSSSGRQLKRSPGLEAVLGVPGRLLHGRGGRLNREQGRRSCDDDATETHSCPRHYR
jgi:hypothetical protein